MSALRYNEDKPELSQVQFFGSALGKLAVVMSQGRIKYPDAEPGVPNWTLGGKPDSEYLDSAMRHITTFIREGEFYDSETGAAHIAHAVWNLLALLELNYTDVASMDESFDVDKFDALHKPRGHNVSNGYEAEPLSTIGEWARNDVFWHPSNPDLKWRIYDVDEDGGGYYLVHKSPDGRSTGLAGGIPLRPGTSRYYIVERASQ